MGILRSVSVGVRRCVGAGVLVLAVACAGARDHVRTIDALHQPDGSIRFVAAIETTQEAFWRELLSALPMELEVAEPAPEFVPDPYGLTLEHLIGLSKEDLDDEEDRALMASTFAWYAGSDPYVLARERCFQGLGKVGERLGDVRLAKEPEDPDGPADVLEDVRGIVAAIGAARDNGLGWSEGLATSCESLAGRSLDLEGGKHTLRVLARLIPLVGERGSPGWEPFWTTVDQVTRTLVAQALGRGLGDEAPRVRAAAMLAALRASGGFGESIAALLARDRSEEVRVAGLRWLATNGYPESDESLSSADRPAFEADWVRLVVVILQEVFEGPAAVWACRALGTLTDAPLSTLRAEEWLAWYYDEGGREGLEGASTDD